MMIINPLVAAAAVAKSATTTITTTLATSRSTSDDGCFGAIENYTRSNPRRPEREPGEIEVRPAVPGAGAGAGGGPSPPLPDTRSPYRLLGLPPGAAPDDVRAAYRRLARAYHPDATVGADASEEERRAASWDFARVNSAYDILKRAEDEGRGAPAPAVEDEAFRVRPTADDGSGIVVRRNERRPRRTTWRERDSSAHWTLGYGEGAFGSSGGYAVSRHSPGQWRAGANVMEHEDHDWQSPGQPDQKIGGEQPQNQQEQTYSRRTYATSGSGFGFVNPQQHLWQDNTMDYGDRPDANNRQSPVRGSRRFSAKSKQGYPYKDRLGYGARRGSFSEDAGPGPSEGDFGGLGP